MKIQKIQKHFDFFLFSSLIHYLTITVREITKLLFYICTFTHISLCFVQRATHRFPEDDANWVDRLIQGRSKGQQTQDTKTKRKHKHSKTQQGQRNENGPTVGALNAESPKYLFIYFFQKVKKSKLVTK